MTMTVTMKKKRKIPKIIAVFNQKGGCGKTMIAMQLAGIFGILGLQVLVVDMDPQNTAKLWALAAPADSPFPAEVISLSALGDQFLSKLQQIIEKFDLVIIDCPPAMDSTVPWVSLLAADLALLPVIPEMGNVWASKQAEELVERARARRQSTGVGGELLAAFALTNVRRGNVFDTCEQVLREQAHIPILESQLSQRNAFPESLVYGCVAPSFGKSAATTEVEKMAHEVAKLMALDLSPEEEI